MTKSEHIKQIAYILECFYDDEYDYGSFFTEMAEYLYDSGCRMEEEDEEEG